MAIIYNENSRTFILNTLNTTYSIHITNANTLAHLYYGAYVPETDFTSSLGMKNYIPTAPTNQDERKTDEPGPRPFDFAPEYSCFGTGDFKESCLMITDKLGRNACELRYKSHRIYKGKEKLKGLPATYINDESEADSLEITCEDGNNGLEIVLQYSVFEKSDIITRSAKAINNGKDTIELKRFLSACVELNSKDYDMITLNGCWGRERYVERLPLRFGKQGVDSSAGTTSNTHNNFIALAESNATEDFGGVYGFCLVYSGSFVAQCEVDPFENTRVVMGINPLVFSWKLEPGEEFQSPEVMITYSASGLSKMSHNFHNIIRNNIIRGKWKSVRRPVLINNWEGTYFDFNEEKLLDIARESAKAGIEMLVMDDGWFGKRDNDRCSLGDWVVNEKKLKGGLPYLVSEVNKLGMKFGIWFEPEMICPDSDLYRVHPDWCLHIEGRRRTTYRSQLVLDYSRKEVRDCVYEQIKKILSSANIEYVKWDMNRALTEVGNAVLPPECQREIWHRYVLGVYELQERLITDFPYLLLENCSSGGNRYDAGMLYYSPQIWTSDNTDAISRLKIQHGTSLCYPCSTMGSHVSASPNHCIGRETPFKTRGHVAIPGTFGYELDTTKLSDDDKAAIKEQIAEFDKYNALVRDGDYYRLADPFRQERFDAWQFVSKDKSETLLQYVQVLKTPCFAPKKVKLKGLDKDSWYVHEESGNRFSGALLMNGGFKVPDAWGDFQSYVAKFTKETVV